MSSRKLVSVQEITNIEPIEGPDRIEVARILGWRVVVGKDMGLKPGDRVAYFETDSLLPAYDPRYKSFQARGQKTMIVGSKEVTGHVLRTVKLRGVYSQGLIMRLDELGFRYTPPADGRHAGRPVRRPLLQVGCATLADAHRPLGGIEDIEGYADRESRWHQHHAQHGRTRTCPRVFAQLGARPHVREHAARQTIPVGQDALARHGRPIRTVRARHPIQPVETAGPTPVRLRRLERSSQDRP
ncbi:hypothetical protein [Bifidobacterium longum]|uniref:hypothetical protein n=1 Tax=Bifidobacterium longum TaxID=216816 RepID=UPI0030F39864